ncbi:hypothetical protein AB0C04_03890 [Micromonospora sp. NPDC048909]|uniref:hypothetical protein n=1 Tax=Micromonospora sp. NPDC048909 TaxID=3155643 RepID=UPI003401193B
MTSAQPPHLAEALRRRGYLISSWPWRALAYLVTTVPIAGLLSLGLLVVGRRVLAVLTYLRTQPTPLDP